MIVTVLGVQKWSIDNDGQKNEGITIHFFDSADNSVDNDRKGIFPATLTADKSLFSNFSSLPAKYDLDLGLRRGSGGKSKPYVKSLKIAQPVEAK